MVIIRGDVINRFDPGSMPIASRGDLVYCLNSTYTSKIHYYHLLRGDFKKSRVLVGTNHKAADSSPPSLKQLWYSYHVLLGEILLISSKIQNFSISPAKIIKVNLTAYL